VRRGAGPPADVRLLARVSPVGVCGVILSAGRGTRLAPFSDTRPKASFPVGSRSLLDRAVDVVRPFVDEIALNVSGHADWFGAHVPPGVRMFQEGSEPLGTAGGLYNMREWIDGRDVVVLNADSVLFGDVGHFIGGRDQAPTRLLVTLDRASPDFDGMWRFVGLSTMDQATVAEIGPDTEDLYHGLWKGQLAEGAAELVPFAGLAIDGGTPANLLAANLVESGGRTVVESGARVDGTAEQCLVLAGGEVRADEHLRCCIIDANARFDLRSNSVVPTAGN
jgi:MurNAc alpha-1-phosphate uridylyltransferase